MLCVPGITTDPFVLSKEPNKRYKVKCDKLWTPATPVKKEIVVPRGSIETFAGVCKVDNDCKDPKDACCWATKTGSRSYNLCGPASTTKNFTVKSGTYKDYLFKCTHGQASEASMIGFSIASTSLLSGYLMILWFDKIKKDKIKKIIFYFFMFDHKYSKKTL